jgi:hypothetical protein
MIETGTGQQWRIPQSEMMMMMFLFVNIDSWNFK